MKPVVTFCSLVLIAAQGSASVSTCFILINRKDQKDIYQTVNITSDHNLNEIQLSDGWVFVDRTVLHQDSRAIEFGILYKNNQFDLTVYGDNNSPELHSSASFGPSTTAHLDCN